MLFHFQVLPSNVTYIVTLCLSKIGLGSHHNRVPKIIPLIVVQILIWREKKCAVDWVTGFFGPIDSSIFLFHLRIRLKGREALMCGGGWGGVFTLFFSLLRLFHSVCWLISFRTRSIESQGKERKFSSQPTKTKLGKNTSFSLG